MKKLFTAAAISAAFFATSAVAAPVSINFQAEADFNEQALSDGTVLNSVNTSLLNVTVSGGLQTNYGTPVANDAYAYLDHGNAGLGVCTTPFAINTVGGTGKENQCNPGSDDNVTANEFVTIAFDVTMILSDFVFRAANHSLISSTSLDTLLIGINGGGLSETSFGALSNIPLFGIDSLTLAYGGTGAQEFYLSSVKAEPDPNIVGQIPLPAGLPLLLAGLGALGLAKRRKQHA
ncbi:VPLPA-CTERM sorting domain-containing protein [Yoonia sp. R2331]|uniref:VPLPA-CTERM sorting domain-containing protein n=1 Tax=Yoonia sp. R2331 TaxID=3237238 RepID=UPI0034E3EA85